jgi:protoporphyrinogen/coproporphyrinogen III oxidase
MAPTSIYDIARFSACLITLIRVGHTNKAVVVGAGISGLACAFRLEQLGIRPILLEASENAGGAISTINRNGLVFEGGPQCPRFPEPIWRLVRDLGLESEFVVGDRNAKRYILRDGRLHLAPFSVHRLLSTTLVGVKSKYRLLSEAFRNSRPPVAEESLAEFVQRKFGREVLDYLVDPFVSTIFFSDAHDMGMQSAFPVLVDWERSHGSVARGAIGAYKSKQLSRTSTTNTGTNPGTMAVTDALPLLGSFRGGMSAFVQKLSDALKDRIQFSAKVESVAIGPTAYNGSQSCWHLRLTSGENVFADTLVVALPAYEAATLFRQSAPNLSSLLAAVEHSPLGVVVSAYRRSQVHHPLDGFGFMVPQREQLHTICTFWNSSLFPEHAPSGTVLMTSFVRNHTSSELAETSNQTLARAIESENAKVLGINGPPIDREVWQYRQALPQYNVGHAQRVAQIRQDVARLRGLYLAGNYLTGRSIGDCAEAGYQAAENLGRHLAS